MASKRRDSPLLSSPKLHLKLVPREPLRESQPLPFLRWPPNMDKSSLLLWLFAKFSHTKTATNRWAPQTLKPQPVSTALSQLIVWTLLPNREQAALEDVALTSSMRVSPSIKTALRSGQARNCLHSRRQEPLPRTSLPKRLALNWALSKISQKIRTAWVKTLLHSRGAIWQENGRCLFHTRNLSSLSNSLLCSKG